MKREKIFQNPRLTRAVFRSIAVVLGALHAWAGRHTMNPDGISYLDVADAYWGGNWKEAINALWSPLYSWILGLARVICEPSPYWEFTVVHLVNFAIYLVALASFEFFLKEFLRYRHGVRDGGSQDSSSGLPDWVYYTLGYALFLWSSLNLITLSPVVPDMCGAALVYLASGLILRLYGREDTWKECSLLGFILGLGFLAKTPMFLMSLVYLAVGFLGMKNRRRAVFSMLGGLFVFVSITGPFIVALSLTKGRLTLGDGAKLNYAWHVNRITRYTHWQGGPEGSGTPEHPPRKMLDSPALYEFATPISGTYPPWYDPSYWYEGGKPYFDLGDQVRILASGLGVYLRFLVGGLLILYFVLRKRWLSFEGIRRHWSLSVPAASAFGMYLVVHAEPRYVAPFATLFWFAVLAGLSLPVSPQTRRSMARFTAVTLLLIMASLGVSTALILSENWDAFLSWRDSSSHLHWRIAKGLERIGVRPGNQVGFIGDSRAAYWARLARVRIVADIPMGHAESFWLAEEKIQSRALNTFAAVGVVAVVAEKVPQTVPKMGWLKLAGTDHFVYLLKIQPPRHKDTKRHQDQDLIQCWNFDTV